MSETQISLNTVIILTVSVVIVMFVLNRYTYWIECDDNDNNREKFVDKYYHWNWNDPDLIKDINRIDNRSNCSHCTYSVSCDYTDDAQPFCYRSLDVPTDDKERSILRTNSY